MSEVGSSALISSVAQPEKCTAAKDKKNGSVYRIKLLMIPIN